MNKKQKEISVFDRKPRDTSLLFIYTILMGTIALSFGLLLYIIITTGNFPSQAKPFFPFIMFLSLNWFYAYLYFTKPKKGKDDIAGAIANHIPVFGVSIVIAIVSNEIIKVL